MVLIDHISLLSSDPEFLADLLAAATDGGPPEMVAPGRYRMAVGGVSIHVSQGDPFRVSTREHIAFRLKDIRLQDSVQALARRGIVPTVFSLDDGARRCRFSDWDGHRFELIERVPAAPPWLSLEQVAERIVRAARAQGGCLVVAIDGRSGSGKSTLARALARRVDAAVIDGDDFYCGGIALRDEPPECLAGQCIDWRAQRQVLARLRAGRPATYRPFDWEAFDGSNCAQAIEVRPHGIVILEGTYSARPELLEVVDLRFVVSTSDEVRIRRLKAREGGLGPWEMQWVEAELPYFEALGLRVPIDGCIDGEQPVAGAAP